MLKPRPQNPIPRGFRIDVPEGQQETLSRPSQEYTKQNTGGQQNFTVICKRTREGKDQQVRIA
jgi:hypothetical protein